jgi:hypothetical protein
VVGREFMKSNILNLIIIGTMSFMSTACSLFGSGSEEQPAYTIILEDDNYEIRLYAPYIAAKTKIDGDFKEAQSAGFRILAGYIFGKNKSKDKISMTAPVVQKQESPNEKISMTAPVIMKPEKTNTKGPWIMTFTMPSKYTLESLPIPNDKRVILEKVESRLVAALRFTGFWNLSKNKLKEDELIDWLKNYKSYEISSAPMFAGYNPPWTLPFLRRNEILIDLKKIK